jgi:putative transposase
MHLSRSVYHYQSIKDDTAVEDKIMELAIKRPGEGQDKIYDRIRNEGLMWNYKRVRRVYKTLRLNKRRKTRRRVPQRIKEPLMRPEALNQTWSMDFMHDSLHNGRKFRVLNIMDDYNREVIAIEAHLSISSGKVIEILDRVIQERAKPKSIRVDNGPEFVAGVIREWCNEKGISLKFIQPGKPSQNGYIERFNRTYRQSVLDAYIFENMDQVRIISEEWMDDYNISRPHEALGGKSPIQFRLVDQDFSNGGGTPSIGKEESFYLNEEIKLNLPLY